ncbi:hypothetical protein [Pelagicoccus sp. SDUM812002]|uniref:hypothetical protein n=1 Tax=Pelagicoccus sp. SDUM812002 TaxID=3041266 RepID=UPI00280C6894|nr:hypothetical protein [Pelagicoccus sp. SDUM812002]MDQ8185025.1 hypothetical protein [Pelagicoccus sp. SDUM812002]
MKLTKLLPVLFVVFLSNSLSVGASTIEETLYSQQTVRVYKLLIQLPSTYDREEGKNHPTVYLTDAQWDFNLVSSIGDSTRSTRSTKSLDSLMATFAILLP